MLVRGGALLHNDIDDLTRYHDGLHYLLALNVSARSLVREGELFYCSLVSVGRHLHGEPCLAAELHWIGKLRVLHLRLVVCWPLGVADRPTTIIEGMIQLLSYEWREWCYEDYELLQDGLGTTLLQLADGYHEG